MTFVFQLDGKVYVCNADPDRWYHDNNAVRTPEGKYLLPTGWFETMPPQLAGLQVVRFVDTPDLPTFNAIELNLVPVVE